MCPLNKDPVPDDPLRELYLQLEPWVREVLEGDRPAHFDNPKLIRDAVHGYHLLHPHEVAVIDCALLQRLRYIHQTAFAYLIYPTAHHTRFDHSLGMTAIADRMLKSVVETRRPAEITDKVMREVRLAALLHDIGHTFFSHLSESIIAERFDAWFKRIKNMEFDGRKRFFQKAAPGEILSYVIVTCKPVEEYLKEAFALNDAAEVDLKVVAGLIVGQAPHESLQFMADMINGPMDADKIDYLLRDCHFSGIRAEVDPERIYYTLDIIRKPGWASYLTVQAGGVPHLEQMLLAKMMLYTSIYHHQKIRTLECMTRAIFEAIAEEDITNDKLRFESIVDFFRITEAEWLTLGLGETALREGIRAILNRKLLKRALVISRNTITKESRTGLSEFHKLPLKGAEEVRRLREAIHGSLPTRHQKGVRSLWVDVPPPPAIDRAADHCWVMLGDEPQALSDAFPTPGWLRAYEANKLRSHVFYVDDEDTRRVAAGAAEDILHEEYGLRFEPLARVWAKIG